MFTALAAMTLFEQLVIGLLATQTVLSLKQTTDLDRIREDTRLSNEDPTITTNLRNASNRQTRKIQKALKEAAARAKAASPSAN